VAGDAPSAHESDGDEAAAKRPKTASTISISRKTELGDSVMTAITIAPLAPTPCTFTHLGVLRKQECERVNALHDELTKCRARCAPPEKRTRRGSAPPVTHLQL
jgi:5-enolpyruvylshikimate-3-phosphate synthase